MQAGGGVYIPEFTTQSELDKKMIERFKTGIPNIDKIPPYVHEQIKHTRFRELSIAADQLWDGIKVAQAQAVSEDKNARQALDENQAIVRQAWRSSRPRRATSRAGRLPKRRRGGSRRRRTHQRARGSASSWASSGRLLPIPSGIEFPSVSVHDGREQAPSSRCPPFHWTLRWLRLGSRRGGEQPCQRHSEAAPLV